MRFRIFRARGPAAARKLGVRMVAMPPVLALAVALCSCGSEAVGPATCVPIGATVSPAAVTLTAVGMRVRLVALFSDCSGKPIPVTWSTSDSSVARVVVADGDSAVVEAVAGGSASIVARARTDTAVWAAAGLTVAFQGPDAWCLPPSTPETRFATRVLAGAGGASELELTTWFVNRTTVHIRVGSGAQCPWVGFYPGEVGALPWEEAWVNCRPAPSIDLAPGDSTVITRVVPADKLATYTPGPYLVEVFATISTSEWCSDVPDGIPVTGVQGVWSGWMELPLKRTP